VSAPEKLAERVRLREAMEVLRQGLPPDAMALVMVGNHLWSAQDIWHPQPRAMLHLALSLLEQATELLPEDCPVPEAVKYEASVLRGMLGYDG
jgi:hypothetical protein